MIGLKDLLIFGFILLSLSACMTQDKVVDNEVPVVDGVMHTVEQGETLFAISQAYQKTPELIRRVNGLRDASSIRPGMRLFIPESSDIREVVAEVSPNVKPDGLYHIVAPGETLIAIANAYSKYGVTLQELQRVNNLQNPRILRVGQRLWIPRALEVQDVDIPKVTVVTADPKPRLQKDVRVETKTPDEPKREATPKPSAPRQEPKAPTPKPTVKEEVKEFPREVKTFGPERFQWPIKEQFTVLRSFSTSSSNLNPGVDLGSEIGTPISAAADGEITFVGSVTDDLGNSFGNYIILYHGERDGRGIYSLYAHNSENLVEIGQKVSRGDMIARMGNTGRPVRSDRGVLHFEIRDLDTPLDPMKVLPPLN